MSQVFELIIFTSSTKQYADSVLYELENQHLFSYRLYRQHAIQKQGYYIKDICSVGRDLKSSIIIDNCSKAFQTNPQNGIEIKPFLGQKNDQELKKLSKRLLNLVKNEPKDIREILI